MLDKRHMKSAGKVFFALLALFLPLLTGCINGHKRAFNEPAPAELNIGGNLYLANVAAPACLTGNHSFALLPEDFEICLEDAKETAAVEQGGRFVIPTLPLREQLVIKCVYKRQPNLVFEYMLASSKGLCGSLEIKIDIYSTARSLIARCLRDLYGRRIAPEALKIEHIQDTSNAIARVIEEAPQKLAEKPLEQIESVNAAYTKMAESLNSGGSGFFSDDFILMLYTAADNASSAELLDSVNKIKNLSFNQNMKIILQLDTPKAGCKRYLHNGSEFIEIKDLKNVNSSSGTVIKNFISWCIRAMPAKRYGLIIGCHSGGYKTNGSYHSCLIGDDGAKAAVSPLEAAKALKGAIKTFSLASRPLAFIGFDASNMAGIECAYEFKSCADYLVFTQTQALPQGFCYFEFLNSLCQKDIKSLSNKALAIELLDSLKPNNTPIAASALDTSAFEGFVKLLNEYFNEICKNITSYGPALAAITASTVFEGDENTKPIYKIQAFENIDYRDLKHLMVSARPQLGAASNMADRVLNEFDKLIIKSYSAYGLQNANGLYICLPLKNSYINNYGGGLKLSEYTSLDFCQKTLWLKVLEGMYK